jgi:hypothetical protein
VKTSIAKRLFLLLVTALCTEATAATISGTISYTGASTGKILVAVLTDSTFKSNPATCVIMDSVGCYTVTGVSDGTYYIASIIAKSLNKRQLTDPWGVYQASGKLGS